MKMLALLYCLINIFSFEGLILCFVLFNTAGSSEVMLNAQGNNL